MSTTDARDSASQSTVGNMRSSSRSKCSRARPCRDGGTVLLAARASEMYAIERADTEPVPAETARVAYFERRYGVGRGVLDGLVNRGQLRKYKFGVGRSGPVVYSIEDIERYMRRYVNRSTGG